MAVDFSAHRVIASLAMSGLSLNMLRLAKQDDTEVAMKLEEQGEPSAPDDVQSYKHRAVVYSALLSGAAALVYLSKSEG